MNKEWQFIRHRLRGEVLTVKRNGRTWAEFLPSTLDSAKLYAERWCV
jgi:hypothetical protein